ncbi:hypothetical protein D3C72_1324790 [compost metagenome]
MGVHVLVVVALRQTAELLAEAFAAGVITTWCAVAVTTPVAERLGDQLELGVVGEHRAAFTHGDVVGWVEAQGGDVSEGADQLAVVGGAQGVTAVFDQPQVVLLANLLDLGQVERVAQGVGEHDGLGFRSNGGLDQVCIDVVGGHVDVDEHRDGAKLHDRVDGRRKAGCYADHFVTFLDGARTQLGRSQRAERH